MRDVPNVDFLAVCDAYDLRTDEARDWAGAHCKASAIFAKSSK
jgi:hypothetical protein